MRSLTSIAGRDMAIDLGTANTLVYVRGLGIVLNEPSVVAINSRDGRALAVGMDAKRMIGRTPAHIQAIRPLRDGVIADFDITERMLRYFIRKVQPRRIGRPRIIVCVPSGITGVERRAVEEAAYHAGARRAFTIEEPMAAAIGVGLPIHEPTGSMIVDVGGGTTEVAIMCLAEIATCETIRVAGDEMDEALANYMKRTYNLTIGPQMAEKIKISIGSASPLEEELTFEVRGRDMISGLPRRAVVTSQEVREALSEPVGQIIDCVLRTLEKAEPELAADLVENGIHVCGGGGLVRGLCEVVHKATDLDVHLVDDPLSCVARGTSVYLENLNQWKDTMESDEDQM